MVLSADVVLCCCAVCCSVCASHTLRYVSGVLGVRCSVRRLCLFVCGRLCDADVRCVECWPSVTAVDVGGCHGLTDEALRAISCTTGNESGERRALQWLSLYWCPQLTDKGVDYLSTNLNCTALLHLSLRSHTAKPITAYHAVIEWSDCTHLPLLFTRCAVLHAVVFGTRLMPLCCHCSIAV